MTTFREHPIFFLVLKYVQLLFTTLVVIFELTQYVSYGNLSNQHNDQFEKLENEGNFNGELKLWVLIVCCFTILSLAYNLASFRKFWDKGTNFWIESFFSALWLSVGLSNLNPVHKGSDYLNCRSSTVEYPSKQFICSIWVASLVLGWSIFGTFILTTLVSWHLSKEVKQKIQWIERGSHSDSYSNKLNSRKSFVSSPTLQPVVTIPIQNDPPEESEKSGVPELLLQSGLPADHRMSLKIVLPQSGPFGQSVDEQQNEQQHEQQNEQQQNEQPHEQQHEQQQEKQQDQINDSLIPPPAPVNASTLTLPEHDETFNSNLLIVPSKKSTEVSSLHEVPL